MREIKFRAWDEQQSKYFYFFIGQGSGCFQETYDRLCLNGVHFEQYTGLKDKNGKEVYEGDIIHVSIVYNEVNQSIKRQFISSIEYFTYRGCYGFPEYHNMSLDDARTDDEMISLEIIGNTHENPELLS